jgi:hypothetical protein
MAGGCLFLLSRQLPGHQGTVNKKLETMQRVAFFSFLAIVAILLVAFKAHH